MKSVLVCSRVSLFPPEHGGAKNIRHVVERLARDGVVCRVLVKMHPEAPVRQRFGGQFEADLKNQEADFENWDPENKSWTHRGVRYLGIPGDSTELARAAAREIESFQPDTVLLCDDALDDARELFEVAAASGRLVFSAQTIHCLPFGPHSIMPSPEVTASIRRARRIIAPSRFVKSYIEANLGKVAQVYYPEVFGQAPFPQLGSFANRYITMINPCPWKGSSIFVELVRRRPELEFGAVLTWGATADLETELRALPNLTLFPETPNIDEIFAKTRLLLVPSLCQEAFGLVSPEALLRGVPVVASDIAGLRESTLGAASLLPVEGLGGAGEPTNDVEPWSAAIDLALADEQRYEERSRRGKGLAEEFVAGLGRQSIASLLN